MCCGIARVSDPPSDREIENIYKTKYYSNANKSLLANDKIIDYRVEHIARPKVKYILRNLTTAKKTWLDIGCGVGEILSVVSERNWDVVGIETNQTERGYAMDKFGLKVTDEYINSSNTSKHLKNYGVISLFGVLEHMNAPQEFIKNISMSQGKGDNLVIEVPNFPSISADCQIAFPNLVNRVMHPPMHLFLFSQKSLEILLKRHNYRINHVWYFGQDYYEFLTDLALKIKDFAESAIYRKISLLINEFQVVIDRHRLSDEILIIAEKSK